MFVVTGGDGFLGGAVVREAVRRGHPTRAMTYSADPRPRNVQRADGVAYVRGDVLDPESLKRAFDGADTVVHTASLISIRRRLSEIVYRTNVTGTRNVIAACRAAGVRHLVYVSSVHALPEAPPGEEHREVSEFDPDLVLGEYAKTKAQATREVLAVTDLEVVVVHPSGLVGPEDWSLGNVTQLIRDALARRLPATVRGGYDFVDVRDVARGVVSAAEQGRPGECYLLTGGYHRITDVVREAVSLAGRRWTRSELPLWLAKLVAPFVDWGSRLRKVSPTFTPYSLRVLAGNGRFSHAKATRELGYITRPWETVRDWVAWIRRRERVATGP